jgi:hypothetical protein
MSENNGSTRLDRIEQALELLISDHVQFREEHKKLLTAQVLLTGQVQRIGEQVERLTEKVDRLTEKVDRVIERVDRVTGLLEAHTQDKNAHK